MMRRISQEYKFQSMGGEQFKFNFTSATFSEGNDVYLKFPPFDPRAESVCKSESVPTSECSRLCIESRPWTAEHGLVSIQSHATYDFTFFPMMKATKVTRLLLPCQFQWYLHVNLTVVVIG
jgi:hypothetical protein